MRVTIVFLALAISLMCGGVASAATVHVMATAPVQLALPLATQTTPIQTFVRANGGSWQTAEYERSEGRITFELRPSQLGGGRIMLLINPPADLDIHDATPPQLIGLKVDGKPLAAESSVNLGSMQQAPRAIRVGFADAENKLDPASVHATVNGRSLPDNSITLDIAHPRRATAAVELSHVEYGHHQVAISIADTAPSPNTAQVTVSFERIDTTNFIAAAVADIQMEASSSFPNYESLVALNDGFKQLTGAGCGNDVSWASAEEATDHWLEVTMPEAKTIKEVTVYWAYSGDTYFTSQKILIQVPDEGGWRNVSTPSPDGNPSGACTTFAFEPVKTDRFRIYQPKGGGSSSRPDLMWLAEIEAR